MKFSRSYIDATEEQKLDDEMNDEINEQRKNLDRYIINIRGLLGNKRSKEVIKSMINHLVEEL